MLSLAGNIGSRKESKMGRKPTMDGSTIAEAKKSIIRTIERDERYRLHRSERFVINTSEFSQAAKSYLYQKLTHPSIHIKIGKWTIHMQTHVIGTQSNPLFVERR